MILILSKEKGESTTEAIINWLKYYKKEYYRFNGEDFFNGKSKVTFELKNGKWSFIIEDYEGCIISSEQITCVWYRRPFDRDISSRINFETSDVKEYIAVDTLNKYHKSEGWMIYSLLFKSLRDCFWLNKPNDITDKLYILEIAEKYQLNIPKTIITNNTGYLDTVLQNGNNLITKASTNGTGFTIGKEYIRGLTVKVNKETLNTIPHEIFFPSLFQKQIEKKYEVRVFFILDVMYSVAIFSQNNDQTHVDYRDYDNEVPNRMELIKLPLDIEEKLILLMKHLDLNCGSIDLIKSIKNEYYFLEVNPVGQFLSISEMGNLRLDKVVAETLIKQSNERQKINS